MGMMSRVCPRQTGQVKVDSSWMFGSLIRHALQFHT